MKYKHKLKNRTNALFSLSVSELMDELKRSLADLSAPHENPELDLWIDQLVAVIGLKCRPEPKSGSET